jgi:hypothetical protein
MAPRADLTGKVFGKWTVIAPSDIGFWLCRCTCGVRRRVRADNLKSGKSKGCFGCREFVNARPPEFHVKTHYAWRYLRRSYLRQLDKRWIDYRVFLAEVGEAPGADYWLRVIDKVKPVNKDNVKWVKLKKSSRIVARKVWDEDTL